MPATYNMNSIYCNLRGGKMTHSSRHYGYDNIKGILIICVVFGHFLELCDDSTVNNTLYLLIYSFHMPVFLFFSGFFAKNSPHKILQLLLYYGCFQILYRLFAHLVLHNPNALEIYNLLLIPYWHLWYLPVLIYCYLLLPLEQRSGIVGKIALILISLLFSLFCGYWEIIGYPLSLSRFFVFCPYFLLGRLIRCYHGRIVSLIRRNIKMLLPLTVLIVFSLQWLRSRGEITAQMLYGTYSYSIGYHPGIRLFLFAVACIWIGVFLLLSNTLLARRIPPLSSIGRNTLPIYLFHGFIVRTAGLASNAPTVLGALICSVCISILLGNPYMSQLLANTKK